MMPGGLGQQHMPDLPALAEHRHLAAVVTLLEVALFEPYQLGDAQASAVEGAEDGTVPGAHLAGNASTQVGVTNRTATPHAIVHHES